MKCPNCNYKHGWERLDDVYLEEVGEKGGFFSISNGIEAVRDVEGCWEQDRRDIKGCPSCGNIFVDVF